MHRKRQPAFTLIELLVVIAVIAIIAAILFPVFAQARDKARQAACLSNEKQIALAISMYRQDWDGAGPFCGWPPGPHWEFNTHSPTSHYEFEWQFTIQPYLKNASVLRCPSDQTPDEERPISYIYNEMMSFVREPFSEANYGPIWSATEKNPPPVNGQTLPVSMFREYSQWGNQAQCLVDPQRGLPRHQEGGHAIYMDLHARWVRYGQGNTPDEKVASVERAFPFATAVAPMPPLPARPKDFFTAWDW